MSDTKFEVEILTKDLIRALNFTSGIIEKRNIKPILGNVKLETDQNNFIITGTSSDISIKIALSGTVKAPGSTTVNIITFSEIVRKLNDEKITLINDPSKNQLIIKADIFSSELSTIPSDEFPALDNKFNEQKTFKIEAKNFLRLLVNTEYAMSSEETRYNLNGVFINSSENDHLNATAIDGHRLSTAFEKIENLEEFAMILPKKTVYELIKILKDSHYSELDLEIEYDKNKVFFGIDKIQLISKLVDATFPEYKALIPQTHSKKLLIQSSKLSETVDRVATITHDKFRAIKLSINPNIIEISAFGETKGTAVEAISNNNIEYFSYEGEEIEIGFNPKYLLDILKNLEDEEIEILLNASLDPIVIKPISFDNDRYIIMPMKV